MREWNYTTNLHDPGGMDDRELLAAAQLACEREVWDRCINTSERTKGEIDVDAALPDALPRRGGAHAAARSASTRPTSTA